MDKTLFITFVVAFLTRDVVMEIYFAIRDELASRKRLRIMDKFMKEFEESVEKKTKVATKKKVEHNKSIVNRKGFQSK
jgi:hypothetical protein